MYDWKKIIAVIIIGIISGLACFSTVKAFEYYHKYRRTQSDLDTSMALVRQYSDREREAKNASRELGETLSTISGGLDKQATSIAELREVLLNIQDNYYSLWCEYKRLDAILNSSNNNVSEE